MSVQIPDEVESRIEALSQLTGESKDALMSAAILTYLEDREDAMIAADRLKNPGPRISLADLGNKYGLAD